MAALGQNLSWYLIHKKKMKMYTSVYVWIFDFGSDVALFDPGRRFQRVLLKFCKCQSTWGIESSTSLDFGASRSEDPSRIASTEQNKTDRVFFTWINGKLIRNCPKPKGHKSWAGISEQWRLEAVSRRNCHIESVSLEIYSRWDDYAVKGLCFAITTCLRDSESSGPRGQ